ncbi:MAG: ferredoxin, partial [Mycobacterium sp.]
LSHADLLKHHHAVIYAVGAPGDRRLDIDGMDLPGAATATEAVAWINGHPDFAHHRVDLGHPRAVIIGNGNVALDVARILTADPESLAATDISDTALGVLRSSAIREVVVAARRDPIDSAFTLPELIGLTGGAEVVLDAADHELVRADLQAAGDPGTRAKLQILAGLPDATRESAGPRIRLAYRLSPMRVLGTRRVEGVEFARSGGTQTATLDAGLVLSSIGYRGAPIPGLPFDESAAVVPNTAGRVVPGVYVAGWIKRGPTGFIGTNKSCAMQTVASLVDDFNAGLLDQPAGRSGDFAKLMRRRRPDLVDGDGWRAIDEAEIARGAALGRPRVKFTSVPEMLAAAQRRPARSRRLSLPRGR